VVEWWDGQDGIDLVVITDETSTTKTLKELAEDASTVEKSTDVPATIVELLKDAGDGRLIVFWDSEAAEADETPDDDQKAIELAFEKQVPAFDITQGMEVFEFGDDDEGDPEGEDEEEKPKRGRNSDGDDAPSEDELNEMGIVALKKLAVKSLGLSEDELKGKRKTTVVRLLLEGQGALPLATSDEEDGADDTEPEEEADEAQAIVRGGVETLEEIPEHVRLTPATRDAIREAAANLAEALLIAFVVEARKPKSAGKPRSDGTEAAPKPPADPDAPKRGRGRPRREESEDAPRERPRSRTRRRD
jgi:hypothetical protein